jgi:hypothetical protein
LNRFLTYSLNKAEVRVQDTITVIAYVSNNVIGEPLAWQFLKDNWDALFARYGSASFQFADLVESIHFIPFIIFKSSPPNMLSCCVVMS